MPQDGGADDWRHGTAAQGFPAVVEGGSTRVVCVVPLYSRGRTVELGSCPQFGYAAETRGGAPTAGTMRRRRRGDAELCVSAASECLAGWDKARLITALGVATVEAG
jgi:hypothetical protein